MSVWGCCNSGSHCFRGRWCVEELMSHLNALAVLPQDPNEGCFCVWLCHLVTETINYLLCIQIFLSKTAKY